MAILGAHKMSSLAILKALFLDISNPLVLYLLILYEMQVQLDQNDMI